MSAFSIEVPFYVDKFARHEEMKDTALELISSREWPPIDTKDTKITRSDYELPPEEERKYLDYLRQPLLEHCFNEFNNTGFNKYEFRCYVHNFWFQQYETGSAHKWHTHVTCQFTGVYYLELSEDSPKTEYIDPFVPGKIRTFDVKEGDIIIFPSCIVHRTKENPSAQRKTILSFNLCVGI
jgi:hypothetical protein